LETTPKVGTLSQANQKGSKGWQLISSTCVNKRKNCGTSEQDLTKTKLSP
jgi:hypothetical protein